MKNKCFTLGPSGGISGWKVMGRNLYSKKEKKVNLRTCQHLHHSNMLAFSKILAKIYVVKFTERCIYHDLMEMSKGKLLIYFPSIVKMTFCLAIWFLKRRSY